MALDHANSVVFVISALVDESDAFRQAIMSAMGAQHEHAHEHAQTQTQEHAASWSPDEPAPSQKESPAWFTDESEALRHAIQGMYADLTAGTDGSDSEDTTASEEEDACLSPLEAWSHERLALRAHDSHPPRAGGLRCKAVVSNPNMPVRSRLKPNASSFSSGLNLATAESALPARPRSRSCEDDSLEREALSVVCKEGKESPEGKLVTAESRITVADADPRMNPMAFAKRGLSRSEAARAARRHGANILPTELPDVPIATFRAIAYINAFRAPAFAMGACSIAHLMSHVYSRMLQSPGARVSRLALLGSAAVLGLSGFVVGSARFLRSYIEAFDRLREHVALAEYALGRGRSQDDIDEELSMVTRNGKQQWISCSELVPGDVLHLQEGRVPADCQLLFVHNGLSISCPISKLPMNNSAPRFFSAVWWSVSGMGLGVGGTCKRWLGSWISRCTNPGAERHEVQRCLLWGSVERRRSMSIESADILCDVSTDCTQDAQESSGGASKEPQSMQAQASAQTAAEEDAAADVAFPAVGESPGCVALSTSIIKSGHATAIVTRTGCEWGAYVLLQRLSSLSLLEVLLLYPMGGVPPHPTRGKWRHQ